MFHLQSKFLSMAFFWSGMCSFFNDDPEYTERFPINIVSFKQFDIHRLLFIQPSCLFVGYKQFGVLFKNFF